VFGQENRNNTLNDEDYDIKEKEKKEYNDNQDVPFILPFTPLPFP
jgi:hypothetical protein